MGETVWACQQIHMPTRFLWDGDKRKTRRLMGSARSAYRENRKAEQGLPAQDCMPPDLRHRPKG